MEEKLFGHPVRNREGGMIWWAEPGNEMGWDEGNEGLVTLLSFSFQPREIKERNEAVFSSSCTLISRMLNDMK